jgi:4-carboxymuconolactone decarboxylase
MTAQQRKNRDFFNQLHGKHTGEVLLNTMQSICPDYVDMTMDFAFGQVWNRSHLDIKTRELMSIAMCTALGDMSAQLKAHIEAAVNCGATKQECVESIIQAVLYSGFARVTNALLIAKTVFGN